MLRLAVVRKAVRYGEKYNDRRYYSGRDARLQLASV